ncbi:MAG: FAD-dependent oxidoreductase [Actinomycetota bacterium]
MSEIDRRQFLSIAALLGVGTVATGCSNWFVDDAGVDGVGPGDGETILIVGAGAAGMATAHLLNQRGVDFRILEAAPTYGGRIKRTKDFVDFPIALGGEWLHAAGSTLSDLVNDPAVEITQRMAGYSTDDDVSGEVVDGVIEYSPDGSPDLKFVGSTWLDFFDEYIVPGIRDRMVFDTQIVRIDHGGDQVVMTDASGEQWTADRIVFTAPMKTLKDGDIEFEPDLPSVHRDALERANIWTGMKVFIEFSEQFWPASLTAKDHSGIDGQHLWYDASHGQADDAARVLGLFTVGEMSAPYQAVNPGDELRDLVLSELDPLFDGVPSQTYLQHVSQDWAKEPFIRAAYLADTADVDISRELGQNIGPRVFMAGCSYTREIDWSSVHAAVRAAADCVDEMYPA